MFSAFCDIKSRSNIWGGHQVLYSSGEIRSEASPSNSNEIVQVCLGRSFVAKEIVMHKSFDAEFRENIGLDNVSRQLQ